MRWLAALIVYAHAAHRPQRVGLPLGLNAAALASDRREVMTAGRRPQVKTAGRYPDQ